MFVAFHRSSRLCSSWIVLFRVLYLGVGQRRSKRRLCFMYYSMMRCTLSWLFISHSYCSVAPQSMLSRREAGPSLGGARVAPRLPVTCDSADGPRILLAFLCFLWCRFILLVELWRRGYVRYIKVSTAVELCCCFAGGGWSM